MANISETCHFCPSTSDGFEYHGSPLCKTHYVKAMLGYSETSDKTPLEAACWHLEVSEGHLQALGLYEDLVVAEDD